MESLSPRPSPIGLLLTRQLASCLSNAVLVLDCAGNLLYYNEPAELLLGERFEETGRITAEVWSRALALTEESGQVWEPTALTAVLDEQHLVSATIWAGRKARRRRLTMLAFALVTQEAGHLGLVAMLWETPATG